RGSYRAAALPSWGRGLEGCRGPEISVRFQPAGRSNGLVGFLLGGSRSALRRGRIEIRNRRIAKVISMKSANATTVLAKIEQRRAVDEVYERLREAILTKQFSPGQRLDTEAIAQPLGGRIHARTRALA